MPRFSTLSLARACTGVSCGRLGLTRDLLLIECQCPPNVARERLTRRAKELLEPSEADWAVYQQQRQRYGESFDELEQMPMLTLRTDKPSAQILDEVLSSLDLNRRVCETTGSED